MKMWAFGLGYGYLINAVCRGNPRSRVKTTLLLVEYESCNWLLAVLYVTLVEILVHPQFARRSDSRLVLMAAIRAYGGAIAQGRCLARV